jgi:hypothetical protein
MSNVAGSFVCLGRASLASRAIAAALAVAATMSACRGSSESTLAPAPPPSSGPSAIHVTTRTALDDAGAARAHIKTVFVIVMENTNWSDVYRSSAAPYINSLLPKASWCTQYYDNPLAVHPSEPNYIWMEAGFHLGLVTDSDPGPGNVSSDNHLTKLMDAAGISWKTYAEDAPAGVCPVETHGTYAPKHVPAVFFTDVVGSPPSLMSPQCIRHVVPYAAFGQDLAAENVARYNFIVPNICSDMHGGRDCPPVDGISQGDDWLRLNVPPILQSKAYADGGALFITWDESTRGEHPVGMILLSPLGKGGGYQSSKRYFHSSLLRTMQEIFGLSPLLNDAANQPDLSDLFSAFP